MTNELQSSVAAAEHVLRQLAHELAVTAELPLFLRSALVTACLAPRPIRTISALAARAHCDRSTLWRQWKELGVEGDRTLKDFLRGIEALQLIVVCSRRGGGMDNLMFKRVTKLLGVHHDVTNLHRLILEDPVFCECLATLGLHATIRQSLQQI